MAPAQRLIRFSGTLRRTEAPRRPSTPPPSPPPKKLKPLSEVMAKAGFAVVEKNDYSDVSCEQCGSGERGDELLLCDKCDRGFHMKCVRPIVARVPIGSWLCPNCSGHHRRLRSFSQKKIIDFFRIQKCSSDKKKKDKCSIISPMPSPQDARKRRRRSGSLVLQKKRRRLLPFVPTEDTSQRLKQMSSLASALTALHMEFSDDLTYMPDMAPRSANKAKFENGGMQVLSKEDSETLEQCRAMCKRGECPPLIVVFDSCEGEGRKKQNCKCVRYSVNGECRVFLVATRDIAKGERLYYDYNGYEHEYPTHHFV
ncbi:hypothetical protein RGQ29_022951 [Quercus rubra]|uniref:Histone-lysine N-methyltransferase ATXR5 n=1 Tax=Quercus rubra TaxID=3512 RepID=A0AAN7F4M3_QUERU|nr:hypothetical protein RGQ29_022951 [Quercus rubra]